MRIIVCLFVALLVATPVKAQQVTGFVESWNTVSKSGTTPEINVYAVGPLKSKLGWSAWTLTTEEWSEALIGLTFAPNKGVELSASIGIETDDDPFRQGASLWLNKGRWSLLSIHENGGSGYWYRYLGTFQATDTVAFGISSIRFVGTGPYVAKKFGKVSLWGTYAVSDKKGILSARYSF